MVAFSGSVAETTAWAPARCSVARRSRLGTAIGSSGDSGASSGALSLDPPGSVDRRVVGHGGDHGVVAAQTAQHGSPQVRVARKDVDRQRGGDEPGLLLEL